MADGAAIPPSKKRSRKPAANGNEEGAPATPKKRGGGRKPKNVDATSPVEDEEEKPSKKVKTEAKGDDEGDWVKEESDGEEDDAA